MRTELKNPREADGQDGMAGILFIISAPSGSGKSTLVNQLRSLVEGLDFSVSFTTRAPRGSEEDGREYHFTTRAEFERMIAAGEFLEWAEVFGNYYGTAVAALGHAESLGRDLLLDIDVQGALQVMRKMPDAVSIFVLPPSPEVLERRLRNRSEAEKTTSEAVIERRLSEAKQELGEIWKYRYALINDVLDQAVAELRAIVLSERGAGDGAEQAAHGCRTDVASARLSAVLGQFG
jgi:guanylate kinase